MDKILFKKKVADSICELQEKKDKDYDRAFDKTMSKFGQVVILIRLYDKFNRYFNLRNSADVSVEDESLVDTLIDLSCYCGLGVRFLEGNRRSFSDIYKDSIITLFPGSMNEAKRVYDELCRAYSINSLDTFEFSKKLIKIINITFNHIIDLKWK